MCHLFPSDPSLELSWRDDSNKGHKIYFYEERWKIIPNKRAAGIA